MPDLATPAAPAPAAPSAPAPSAPAPVAPAPVSTPAPVTPAAPVVPAAEPIAPAAPAKFNPETAAAPPSKTDYPDTQDGMDAFVDDAGKWNLLHPEEAQKLRTERFATEPNAEPVVADPVAEAAAKVEDEKPVEAPKPADAPPVAATPAKVEEWTTKSPELKAAFDKSPELRTEIMEMARQNAEFEPIREIVGTKEEAQFAVEHANRLVTLQANWMLGAEDSDMLNTAWDQTVDMFKERDDKGAEIKGADGKPKLGADFQPFVRKATSTFITQMASDAQSQIATLEARLAGNYATEEARTVDADALENAKYEKAAYDFILAKAQDAGDGGTKLPALPPNATQEQIEFQKKLEERQRDLDAKDGKQTKESRKAASRAVDNEVQTTFESGLNKYIDTQVAAMKERGEYLPEFVLSDKWINPQTGKPTAVSAFGARLYLALNEKIASNPIHRAKLASLQALGAAGKESRIAEVSRLQNLYLPGIFQKEVTRIQDGIRGSAPKSNPQAGGVARVEPQSAATVVPSGMNNDQLRSWAETEAKKADGFAGMTPQQKEEVVMEIAAKKKYGG